MHNKRTHLFHIINPAPWPFFVSISLFNILIGVILWVNKYIISSNIIIISFIILLLFVQFWFTDIVREASFEGKHSSVVQNGLKLGMILFIVSEVMFFFGFFWAYFHFSLSPSIEIGCLWPPYGIQVFNYLHVPLYNTFVLLLSGVCVTWCHHSIISTKKLSKKISKIDIYDNVIKSLYKNYLYRSLYKNVKDYKNLKGYKIWPILALIKLNKLKNRSRKFNRLDLNRLESNIVALILTILLAIHFTYFQLQEYTDASFNISDSVYGSIFFMATGFHGFHVVLGTCFLIVCFIRLWKGHFGKKHHLGLEFAIWYWHFVDVVWLFLYVCVYWWASTSLI